MNLSALSNNIVNSVNNLSRPAYIYFISVLVVNLFSLFMHPFNCTNLSYFLCIGIFLFSIFLTILMIYIVTWVIEKIYVSGYTTVAWIISVLLLIFHVSDFLKMFNLGNKKVSENFENNDEEETLEFEDYNKEEEILGLNDANIEVDTEEDNEGELEEENEGELEEENEEELEEVIEEDNGEMNEEEVVVDDE